MTSLTVIFYAGSATNLCRFNICVLVLEFQIMTSLDVCIPVGLLLDVFHVGVESMAEEEEVANEPPDRPHDCPILVSAADNPLLSNQSTQQPKTVEEKCDEREERDPTTNLKCYSLMLDLLLQQVRSYNKCLHIYSLYIYINRLIVCLFI